MDRYDVVVIGGGAAGINAVKVATALKANEAQTLAAINKGEYKDRGLSVLRRAGRQLHRPSDAGREEPQGFDG